MQNRNEILNELRDVAPLTATLEKQNLYVVPAGYFEYLANEILQKIYQQSVTTTPVVSTYKVPAGYFDGLAEGILQKIKAGNVSSESEVQEELKQVAPVLNTIDKKNIYSVPADYFENLSREMLSVNSNSENDIKIELPEHASLLNNISKENVFTVPQGYFQQLSENVLAIINSRRIIFSELEEIAPSLNEIDNKNPYLVPSSFFDDLAGDIVSGIRDKRLVTDEISAELQEVAPLLISVSRKNLYTIPDGYFESMNITVPAQSKIVPLPSRRKWYKYAVAAAVTGLLILAGTTWFKGNNPFLKFKEIANTNVQKEIAGIADDDIINYLDHQPVAADFASTGSEDPDPDVNEFIHNASNEEIEQYLKDNAEPGENENVIKNI